jgi:GT2 family glycosyltransferase
MNNKIGCALITCDRPEFYKISVGSLMDAIQKKDIEYIVINDGKEKLPYYPLNFIETTGYNGVAKAKNKGIDFLINVECDHIFLMEDDIEISDCKVFEKYIEAFEKTNIKHFNYALHGNHNLKSDGTPNSRKRVKYPNNFEIDLFPNVLGAFSYYHRDVIDAIGKFDEGYYNAMEHVEHTYRAFQAGFTTPFRWFCDIIDSSKYLKDIVPNHQNSKIRKESNFQEIFKNGLDRFIQQNGFSVISNYGPPEKYVSEPEMLECLKDIYKNSN